MEETVVVPWKAAFKLAGGLIGTLAAANEELVKNDALMNFLGFLTGQNTGRVLISRGQVRARVGSDDADAEVAELAEDSLKYSDGASVVGGLSARKFGVPAPSVPVAAGQQAKREGNRVPEVKGNSCEEAISPGE